MARPVLLLAALSLASSAAPAMSATVARPGTIVFASARSPAAGLYAESAAGGPLRDLRAWAPNGVVWSPDGRRFLFDVPDSDSSEPQLWISDANGRHRHVVAFNAGQPTWAPDNHRITFVRDDAIWVMHANGTRQRRLTQPDRGYDGSSGYDHSPQWSPDGRLIAFLRGNPPTAAVGSRLMAISPNGTGLRRIAHRVFVPPSWSPDGKRIAFDSSGPRNIGSWEPNIYVARPNGLHRQRLTDSGLGGYVAWSPNGHWIAFNGEAANDVSVVHPDGRGLRRIFSGRAVYSAPVWAPDSQLLAVVEGQPSDIWVVGMAGHPRRLTEGWRYGYSNSAPTWQPRKLPPQRLGGTVVSPAIPTDSALRDGVLQTTRPIKAIAWPCRCSSTSWERTRTASRRRRWTRRTRAGCRACAASARRVSAAAIPSATSSARDRCSSSTAGRGRSRTAAIRARRRSGRAVCSASTTGQRCRSRRVPRS